MFKTLLSYTILVVTLAPQIAMGQTIINPTDTLTLSNIRVAPDGFERPVVAVNGAHINPLIRATKGDNFNLNVVNNLDDPTMLRSTSVHWHGLLQKGSTHADGAEAVSQCPISPGHSFRYQFGTGDHAGTFWYHSHFGTQYCDGLRGPLVVYDPNDPHKDLYEVDDENTVITLADWYHTQAPSVPAPATPDSTLINGKGRSVNGPKDIALSIVNVEPGKKYRFRLASLSCDPNYRFSIDGHTLKVIEADGQSVKPIDVTQITIFTGQRYSFVLEANQPVANYWIRALPNIGKNGLANTFADGVNSAILRYKDAPEANPASSQQSPHTTLLEQDLRPFNEAPAPGVAGRGNADVNLQFNFAFRGGKFFVNDTSFEPPEVPVLLQILSGKNPADLLPAGSIYSLPRGKVVEVTLPGLATAGPHPFHMHGHAFSVIRSAGSTVDNYDNPPVRDVVNIGGANDKVTIRFTTDNPGPWFFHCHIEFHLAQGLAIVFAEDVDGISLANPIPNRQEWEDLCEIYRDLPADQKNVVAVPPASR
ncbi:laccase 1 precursor [Coprinellus micaceus]|uniref:Laccase 1 n=1 Tax=Coprinellus micaceus TaxID=71717 RepID=A0A4Y7TV84_COPMI|nr:laccase 1 precursor [Coprinellus micaceus]